MQSLIQSLSAPLEESNRPVISYWNSASENRKTSVTVMIPVNSTLDTKARVAWVDDIQEAVIALNGAWQKATSACSKAGITWRAQMTGAGFDCTKVAVIQTFQADADQGRLQEILSKVSL